MNEEEFDNLKLSRQLMGIPRLGWRYATERCAKKKMTSAMINICMVIYQNDRISQDGVAKALKMDKSSVAKIVNRAEKAGFIARSINKKDMRERLLTLTESGEEVVHCFNSILKQWQDIILSSLPEKDAEEFASMVDTVYQKALQIEQIEG